MLFLLKCIVLPQLVFTGILNNVLSVLVLIVFSLVLVWDTIFGRHRGEMLTDNNLKTDAIFVEKKCIVLPQLVFTWNKINDVLFGQVYSVNQLTFLLDLRSFITSMLVICTNMSTDTNVIVWLLNNGNRPGVKDDIHWV